MADMIALGSLPDLLGSPMVAELASVVSGEGPPYVVVDLRRAPGATHGPLIQPSCPVIGYAPPAQGRDMPEVVDVLAASADDLTLLTGAIEANPIAATVLVQLLRHHEGAAVGDALLAESLAYSTLQHGAEFEAWLAGRKRRPVSAPAAEPVLIERDGDRLLITLNRPERHNAYSRELRDALCAALQLAVADTSCRAVVLRGAGASFSAGGDLDEFGEARDAAVAHATRTTRNAASLIHRIETRVVAELHGACIGAGIELPAFAGRVVASEDAFFLLPEVAMGLIPGAGGTVSISRRIGRRQTAYFALSNRRIDPETALRWGLIDAIVP